MTRASASSPVHQSSVRARMLQAYIGMQASEFDKLIENFANVNPQAGDVRTLTVDAFVGAADYVFSFNGVEHTVTEDGTGANVTDVATQIREYMEAEGSIYGVVDVAQVANVLTLTAKLPGFTFTLSDTDANLTSALVSAAADASVVEFGRALVRTGMNAGGIRSVEDAIPLAAKADSVALVAQVDTWTVGDPGAGQFIGASLNIKGADEVIVERVLWNTDLDTTLDNLATVLNAALTDRGLNAYVSVAGPAGSPGAGELRFSAVFDGVEFTSMVTSDDAAGYPAITVSTNKGTYLTSFDRSFAGVALRVSDAENTAGVNEASVASYEANSTMLVLRRGEVWVENSQVLVYGDPVFVDLASGEGRFYNSPAAGRIPISIEKAEWIKSGRSLDGEALGLLRLK